MKHHSRALRGIPGTTWWERDFVQTTGKTPTYLGVLFFHAVMGEWLHKKDDSKCAKDSKSTGDPERAGVTLDRAGATKVINDDRKN